MSEEEEELIGGLLHDRMLLEYTHAREIAFLYFFIVAINTAASSLSCGYVRWAFTAAGFWWGIQLGKAAFAFFRARRQWKVFEGKQFAGFVRTGPVAVK